MSALSTILLLGLGLQGGNRTATVDDLTCEYLRDPICVDSPHPRLSWNTRHAANGWKQSGYEIQVASETKKLLDNEPNLWDTGRTASDSSIQIPYEGKPLHSRQTCVWRVRVWNPEGLPSDWSRIGRWEMGLLKSEDWSSSQWIGTSSNSRSALPAPFLRKGFVTTGKVKRATLYVSGLGYAELHLNGKKLGDSERDPGYTNFDKRVLYVTHDVTRSIRSGRNVIGAVLGTGWYDVHDQATWRFENAPWRDRPKIRSILIIEYADGRNQTVVSDSTWKVTTGPIRFDGIYTGEIYDARLEFPEWDSPSFDDRNWNLCSIMASPKGVLAPRLCPPVAIRESIRPVSIYEPKPGIFVVDFGQNIAGHARLKVKGPSGTKITMRYSERIGGDGMIERSQIETFMDKTTPSQPFQSDTYICSGKGTEVWEQRFSYSGFRYMEVVGFPGRPSTDSFQARFAHTDFESAGDFQCSDSMLNKIQRATRYSYLSNAQSIPTDCPQREKNGWMGDAHLAAEAGLMNFCSATFYTKWLDDLADDQGEKGNLSLIIPTGGWGRGACHPAWDSAYAIIANDLYDYCGDKGILVKHYHHLRRYVDFLYGQTQDDVVPFDSLGDWVPWSTQTPSQLTSTIFLYVDAVIVAKAARLQGNLADALKYASMAQKVKLAFTKHFLTSEMIGKSSQTTLSMAIYFGLVDGEAKNGALAALVKNVSDQGHIDTGILGAKFVLRVLSEAGRTDLAYKLVTRKDQPSWAWWIGQGATTLWEDWKGESSLNHIMFGDVSNWFYQWIAGIGLDPISPAFHHVLIHPQPVGDLTWARASVASPYGVIKSSWKRNGTRFQLNVDIPPNSTASVRVPGICRAKDRMNNLRQEPDATIFEIGSGTYQFESVLKP